MMGDDAEDYPDEYLSDLPEEVQEEVQTGDAYTEERNERQDAVMLLQASLLFGKLFTEEYITLREYIELTEPLEEYRRDADVTVL